MEDRKAKTRGEEGRGGVVERLRPYLLKMMGQFNSCQIQIGVGAFHIGNTMKQLRVHNRSATSIEIESTCSSTHTTTVPLFIFASSTPWAWKSLNANPQSPKSKL